ncbi:MAG: dihydrodipicolinate synthase family protein [Fimbriiglobus sp.]|nr:dihydrodipicolinate synthase family protein [Fimbriiglobus sp.]
MLSPFAMTRPRRRIVGMSAILLPFRADGAVDWDAFRRHVARTADNGLAPAVNMDTGYANLIDADTRERALAETAAVMNGREYVAGAYVGDTPGAKFDLDGYRRAVEQIQRHRGTPVVFQSFGLTALPGPELVRAYEAIARDCPRFVAFELGTQFAPFGKIYDLDTYAGLLGVTACIGAKHSSLHRQPEWKRLALRDRVRPDFLVLTGNDLAVDMVVYGSDYLLGLSTFAPDLFAKRDAMWAAGDPAFYELNDLLQYLGFFAFRPPVPAYKHSAAMFLKLRGWIACDDTHPASPKRPDSDREVLRDIVERLHTWA